MKIKGNFNIHNLTKTISNYHDAAYFIIDLSTFDCQWFVNGLQIISKFKLTKLELDKE
jgi:hypothetical protein